MTVSMLSAHKAHEEHAGLPIIPSSESPWDDPTERAAIVVFDPEDAAYLIEERNAHNRPQSQHQIAMVMRQLTSGLWRRNGETIVFDSLGRVHDGQHRLTACVKTGIPLMSWCIFGIDPETFRTIDRGRRRTSADDLALIGEKRSTNLAATLALIYMYEQGRLHMVDSRQSIETHELEAVLERHPGVRDAVDATDSRSVSGRLIPPRVLAFCRYQFGQSDAEKAQSFFHGLDTGEGLREGDPALTLRNRLMMNKASSAKMSKKYAIALVIKAWNAHKAGRVLKHLRWSDTGATAEDFPGID